MMMGAGDTISFGVVLTWEPEEGGGAKNGHPVEGRVQKVIPCLEWGAHRVWDAQFFHFVAFPLPIINI